MILEAFIVAVGFLGGGFLVACGLSDVTHAIRHLADVLLIKRP